MDANKFFGDVSKIPIVGEFIISSAIYLVLSVLLATTEGFGLDPRHHPILQYIFLAIAIAYFMGSLGFRLWNYFNPKEVDNNEF